MIERDGRHEDAEYTGGRFMQPAHSARRRVTSPNEIDNHQDRAGGRRYATRRTHNDDAEHDMGPSEKSFQQVKSILGKLDRSIDSVRQARLQPTPPSNQVPNQISSQTPAQAAPAPLAKPTSTPPAQGLATQPARPSFGRAQPLPRATNGNPGGKWL
jgi:hypothetical protein